MSENGAVKCRFCDFVIPKYLKDGTARHYGARLLLHIQGAHARQLKAIQQWAEAASTVPPPGRAT